MQNTNKAQRTKNLRRQQMNTALFFRTLLISLILISLLVFSAGFIISKFVIPPAIPEVKAEPNLTLNSNPNLDEPAFHLPDGDMDDMLIGDGLHAPEGFTSDDRKDQFYTFLIIGKDGGVNTDTIMVASYDGINKEASVIGIPRDSKVNVKRRLKKINAAYAVGQLYGDGPEAGVDQLKREIKSMIGFVPDYYIAVDLEAFEKIIDTIGGIDVNVPFHMKYRDPEQDLYINIPEGEQHLEGADALKFARYRKGIDGSPTITDYQRIENQQAVISATIKKLLTPASITKIPEFIEIFTENVECDIKLEHILWFADQLNRINGTGALSTYTLPTTGTSGSPDYYEYPDKAGILNLVNQSINPYIKDIEAKDLDIAGE